MVEKKKKKYDSPMMTIIEMVNGVSVLVGSNDGGGELPPNPNIPI